MDRSTLERRWDELESALSLETFEQHAGRGGPEHAAARGRSRGAGGDPKRMEEIAGEIEAVARGALDALPRESLPPLLWQGLVAARSARELTRLQNETYRLRNETVAVDVAGDRVDLNNVRRFNHRHARDGALRARAFEALMGKARALTPTLEARFRLSASVWAPFQMTPLDAYCAEEGVSAAHLERLVAATGDAARAPFQREAERYALEILGKRFEAHDDMYVFRHTVFAPVDEAFGRIDMEARFAQLARGLGFDVDLVHVDGEPREGKFSSPVCFGVRIPGDVRILYQRTSPFGDHESFYHEMGHALHFAYVDPRRAFHERRLIPSGTMEIFSTLFEEIGVDPVYLRDDLGLPDEVVQDALARRRFMELYFLTFYAANSLHKVRFWQDRLHDDFAAADALYAELTERFMGVALPGIYWQTHHVLSMSDVYAPSYLLAHVRKAELYEHLVRRFGRAWWRVPDAGAYLRERFMAPGASLDLSFSKLDPEPYLRHVLGASA